MDPEVLPPIYYCPSAFLGQFEGIANVWRGSVEFEFRGIMSLLRVTGSSWGASGLYSSCKMWFNVNLSASGIISPSIFVKSTAPRAHILKLCSSLFTVGDKWGTFLLSGVTACPYYSTQAINRQKPVTHLIKLKSSSCQTLCLALPSFGSNGCLWSIMPQC